MILTTSEAATELGLSPFAVRKMVEREELVPIIPGAKPLRFHLLDVAHAQARRVSKADAARLDAIAEEWRALG